MKSASGVLFTHDTETEIAMVREGSKGHRRKIFVHGRGEDVAAHRAALPEFTFVAFDETTTPENGWIQAESRADDFFALYRTCPAKIPDRNLGTYQSRTKGTKYAIHDHPFCGKAEAWWVYFPYSYVDKTLLGYPHSYAIKGAAEKAPLDVAALARQVAAVSATTLDRVYDGIGVVEVSLTPGEHRGYEDLRKALFDAGTFSPRQITRALKKFVDDTDTVRAAHKASPSLPLLDLNRLWPAYRKGLRQVVVSDAKVDRHLLSLFQDCTANANAFVAALKEAAHG